MPAERKIREVEELSSLMESCTVAVVADYSGMDVNAMTELRRALRGRNVKFRVVKNRLAHLAADAAGKPQLKEIVNGPAGIAFGYDDPVEPARALTEFIIGTRAPMKIGGGLLGDRSLSSEEVAALAALPPRDELLGKLLGQLQSPITSFVYVLAGPMSSLARLLQKRIESLANDGDISDDAESDTNVQVSD